MTSPAPQQTPVIRSAHWATGSQEPASIVTGADTAVGDVLIAIRAADWDTVSELGGPYGTAGTWRYVAVGDRGENLTHVQMWDRKVTTKGAQRVTVGCGDESDIALIVIVLDGTSLHPSSWYDAWAGNTGSSGTSHVAAAVTPTGTADLLVTAFAMSDSATAGKSIGRYTSRPAGSVSALRQGSAPSATDYIYSDEYITLGVYVQALTAAGATGTRTAIASPSRGWATATLAIRGATLAVPIVLDGDPARSRARGYDGVIEMTGFTHDGDPARAHGAGYEGELTRDVDGDPAHHSYRGADGDLPRTLTGPRAQSRRSRGFDGLLDNMTGSPVRVRHQAFHGVLEFRAVIPQQVETRPRARTRPRRRLRFYAQEVESRRIVSRDVGLGQPKIRWKRNAHTEISGKIAAKELAALGIRTADLFIHAELDGAIRASGILTPSDFAWGGPEIDITAKGVTSYLNGLSYEADFTLRGETGIVGQQLDPLDVYRHLWAYVQSFPDGRLGVVLSNTKSSVRIGEKERDLTVTPAAATAGTPTTATTPATGAATATDITEQTKGPWLLKWWEDSDLGRVAADLATSTPFDYREMPYWNADRTDVVQFVELGWPRCGRRRDDLVFAQGENLDEALTPVMNNAETATEVYVLGKGEGSARIRGRYGARVPGRLRRTAKVEKKDCSTTPMADAFARAEWPRRQGFLSFDEVVLKAVHRNAPLGSFLVADDVPVRARVEGFGQVLLRHRVEEWEWEVMASKIRVKTERSDTFSYGSSALAT